MFTCTATGYQVSYEWMIGSGSFPDKVTGINSDTLMIPDVRSSDDNTYTCVASTEGGGNVSSNTVQLTVTGMTIYGDGIKTGHICTSFMTTLLYFPSTLNINIL